MLDPYRLILDTALSGLEAIKKLDNNYDLIFMDHMMPEMDGIETLKHIREWEKEKILNNTGVEFVQAISEGDSKTPKSERPEGVPIIMLTASAMSGMKEYYLNQGFDAYLSKPINTKELDELLKRWLKTNEQSYTTTPLAVAMETNEIQINKLKHNRFALLMRLNEALTSGETLEAEKVLGEMGNSFTEPEDRKLYFRLYDLMLTGDTEKMLEELRRSEE
jgi:CheY-like chemotaxis protein